MYLFYKAETDMKVDKCIHSASSQHNGADQVAQAMTLHEQADELAQEMALHNVHQPGEKTGTPDCTQTCTWLNDNGRQYVVPKVCARPDGPCEHYIIVRGVAYTQIASA